LAKGVRGICISMKRKERIGIPRSLLYYKYFPLWKTFFEELGCEVVLSDPSNAEILNLGSRCAIDEICIPLKLYYGHIQNLLRKDIDLLFVPRYVSLTFGTYMCPKFLALPDMIRGTIANIPPLLEMDVDLRKRSKLSSAVATGRRLKRPLPVIKRAYGKAVKNYRAFIALMEQGANFREAMTGGGKPAPSGAKKLSIAVIGHGYNVHDSFINMDLLKHLKKMDAEVIVLENLPSEIFKHATSVSSSLKNYWGNEEEILSAVNHIFARKSADGIIFLCSFCCGPDSLIDELITRNARAAGIPYICLVLDEHSGSAGVITRIEAFVDMIARKKRAQKK